MPDEPSTTETEAQTTQPEATGEHAQPTEAQGGEGGETLTFDNWLTQQDDATKSLLDSHTRGLKSALESERQSRKDLAKQVKELSDQAEAGSALKGQLDKLSAEMESRELQAAFYEEAHKLKVVDLKAAFVLAREGGLLDDRGRMDWDAFKQQYGYLIERPVTPRGNAGTGTGGSTPTPPQDMNALIRRVAGVTAS